LGASKSNLFSESQKEIAFLAKAIGHPARVAILNYLHASQTCINSDLVQELGLAQATISQHLKELKEIGIIQGSIEGTSICYCINAEKWAQMSQLFSDFFSEYSNLQKSSCC
jgi:predicted transcriptional regulator